MALTGPLLEPMRRNHAELQAHRHYRGIGVGPGTSPSIGAQRPLRSPVALHTARIDRVAIIFARPGEPGSGLYPAELGVRSGENKSDLNFYFRLCAH